MYFLLAPGLFNRCSIRWSKYTTRWNKITFHNIANYPHLTGIFDSTLCCRFSGEHLISSATLMLVATLWGAAGMGFWHGALFYELNRVSKRKCLLKDIQTDRQTDKFFDTIYVTGFSSISYYSPPN